MDINQSSDDTVLLTLQNNARPNEIVYLVMDKFNGHFRTKGLKDLFGVKEIRVESSEVIAFLPEYAQVLTFLIESMSAAQDLRLPYGYQDEFTYGDTKYSLYEEGDYRVLRRIDNSSFSV
jgi:hypothetical protein